MVQSRYLHVHAPFFQFTLIGARVRIVETCIISTKICDANGIALQGVTATLTITRLPKESIAGTWIASGTQTKTSNGLGVITFDAVPQNCYVRLICSTIERDAILFVPLANVWSV